jgi:hypothetical protein
VNAVLERRFAVIGARAKVERVRGAPRIDVGVDRRGELFALRVPRCRAIERLSASSTRTAINVPSWVRRAALVRRRDPGAAKEALQPDAVRDAVARARPRDRFACGAAR